MFLSHLVVAVALAQNPSANSNADDVARSAQAAEKAAASAAQAAEAASRAAAAVEKMAAAYSGAALANAVAPDISGAPAAAPAAPPPSSWSGTAGLGFVSLTGNAESITLNANVSAEHKTNGWIFGGKAAGVYGQARLANALTTELIAFNANLQLRADREITKLVSVFLLAGADTDHVKSIEWRGFGEAGAGIFWIDTKEGDLQKLLLRTDLAFRYAREARFQYLPTPLDIPDVDLVAPRVGVAFRYALTKEISFREDAEVLLNVLPSDVPSRGQRVLVNSATRVSARLTKALSLGVGFDVKFDSDPAAGKQPTDTALTVGLEAAF